MRVSLDINEKYEQLTVKIQCHEMDDKVKNLLEYLKGIETEFLIGRKGEMQYILKPNEIHYFHTERDAVLAVTKDGSFKIREKLYELEKLLPTTHFVRLSKSAIANLHELNRFEASFNGTLCVYFKSGEREYVSRHYVPSIKEALKMNRRISK